MYYLPVEKPELTNTTWEGLVDYVDFLLIAREELTTDRKYIEEFCNE